MKIFIPGNKCAHATTAVVVVQKYDGLENIGKKKA
jgi:hypothetical protein